MRSTPIELNKLEERNFSFKQNESYLILVIYKAGKEGKILQVLTNFNKAIATLSHSLTVYGELSSRLFKIWLHEDLQLLLQLMMRSILSIHFCYLREDKSIWKLTVKKRRQKKLPASKILNI